MTLKIHLTAFMALLCMPVTGQANTAVTSGSIGKCSVWNYPYTLYNSAAASQTVNDGVTVTVDQDRSIGAVDLSGSGAMSMSGANGITLSGSGTEITCRWDVSPSKSSLYSSNGSVDKATYFTAPSAGNYTIVLNSHYQNLTTGGDPHYEGYFNNTASRLFYRLGSADSPHLGVLSYDYQLLAGNKIYLIVQACLACTNTSTVDVTLSSGMVLYQN